MDETEHQRKRRLFYARYAPFWFDLEDTPYALYDCCCLPDAEIKQMRDSAEKITKIYHKTATLLQQMKSDTYYELGFPEATFPFLAHPFIHFPSIIQRLDMVFDGESWKHYEINSDTPTFIMECYEMNDQVATHFGYHSVNDGKKEILIKTVSAAIEESLADCGFLKAEAKIVFTAHQASTEDWETTRYLAGLLTSFDIEVLPLDDLRIVSGEGLYTKDGARIHLLYRQTYPLEFLVLDKDEQTGEAVGVELLQLVVQKKLAMCNPISAFLLQSKAVQALIWGFHEMKHPCFTEFEHAWIEAHFLPTYLEADTFIEKGLSYVEKPVFGREGDTIRIVQKEEIQQDEKKKQYDNQLKIYQKYVPLPKRKVQTPSGQMQAFLLMGCFMIGESVGAIGARAGHLVTGNESYFLPIGREK